MEGAARMRNIIVIPSRMGSTRLPGKPLATVHGLRMVIQVWLRAIRVAPTIVACDCEHIAAAVRAAGGAALLTDPGLPSGTDRVAQALARYDPDGWYQRVLNLQGDLPLIPPEMLSACLSVLDDPRADVSTLVSPLSPEDRLRPSVVKAIVGDDGRAIDFRRVVGPGEDAWHHIGVYGFTRDALARFAATRPVARERGEHLEQHRAMAAGLTIVVGYVDRAPIGVDTPADLRRVEAQGPGQGG